MRYLTKKLQSNWQDAANLLLGAWLAVAPFTLTYAGETSAAWNAYAVGAAIILMAAVALWNFHAWEEWINTALGAWLIASPWVLGYTEIAAATWNHVVVGCAVCILALWSAASNFDTGGLLSRS